MFFKPQQQQRRINSKLVIYMKDYRYLDYSTIRRSYDYFLSFPTERIYPLNKTINLKIEIDYLDNCPLKELNLFSERFWELEPPKTFSQKLALYFIFLMHHRKMVEKEFIELLFVHLVTANATS